MCREGAVKCFNIIVNDFGKTMEWEKIHGRNLNLVFFILIYSRGALGVPGLLVGSLKVDLVVHCCDCP